MSLASKFPKPDLPETEYFYHLVNAIHKSGIVNIIHFSMYFCRKLSNAE